MATQEEVSFEGAKIFSGVQAPQAPQQAEQVKAPTKTPGEILDDVIKNTMDFTPGFGSYRSFELAQRGAKLLASSSLVPTEYRGNISNCVIALNMANRIGADPLMVMQNLVIVHGRPTWSSQFLIATVNTCGRFTALRYEFFGEQGTDSWGCHAWATEKATGQKLTGTDITIGLAKKEGWYGKNGSKWQSMPQQMLMYRAGAWWTRAYAPELSMGLHTDDEVVDVTEQPTFTVLTKEEPKPEPAAPPEATKAEPEEKRKPPKKSNGTITEAQAHDIASKLESFAIPVSEFKRAFDVSNIVDLPASRFDEFEPWLNKAVDEKNR